MTRYVYGDSKRKTKRTTKRGRTASKKIKGTKRRKMNGGNKTRKQCGGSKTRKQYGGKKTGFLGSLLKPLVLPALFFGAQKVQQKRVLRKKSKSAKK